MSDKRFTVMKFIENCDIASDVIGSYCKKLVEDGKDIDWVTIEIRDNDKIMTYKEVVDLLNSLNDENEELLETNRNKVEIINNLFEENEQLKQEKDYFEKKKCEYWNKYNQTHLDRINLKRENEKLKSENKRLTDKLNETALEFLNYDMVTMSKATEISEMCYYDFLKFRKLKGDVE